MPLSVSQAVSETTNKFPGETTMKKTKVEEVCMKSHLSKALTLLLSALFSIPVVAFAGQTAASESNAKNNEIAITCGDQPGHRSISGVLAHLDPTQPHTIRVSGTCKENVVIQSFDRLTLIANPGATINDASGGNADVVDIEDSQRITLQGFTINGGANGITCGDHSLCHFKGNTIQGTVNGANGDGVDVVQSSHATLEGDVIQYNGGDGLDVADGSSEASVSGAKIQYNAGAGIFVGLNSTLRANGNGTQIVGNGGAGVSVFNSSVARFGRGRNFANGNIITNNAGPGVLVRDLSFALFGPFGNMVTLNNTSTGGAGFDVDCEPKLSATGGASSNIGGGTTNCVGP
jgi:parallel beta helix pectate lyase-like protein